MKYPKLLDDNFEPRYHYHKNEQGLLIKCYHGSVDLITNWRFWAGLTLGFPFEHFLWEKIWPFYIITKWFGL